MNVFCCLLSLQGHIIFGGSFLLLFPSILDFIPEDFRCLCPSDTVKRRTSYHSGTNSLLLKQKGSAQDLAVHSSQQSNRSVKVFAFRQGMKSRQGFPFTSCWVIRTIINQRFIIIALPYFFFQSRQVHATRC